MEAIETIRKNLGEMGHNVSVSTYGGSPLVQTSVILSVNERNLLSLGGISSNCSQGNPPGLYKVLLSS